MRALVVGIVLALVRSAYAYPQFQLSKDQTCSGCHVSLAGGGLLSENGLATSETMSQFGTKPEFLYGALPTPTWLTLGGDLRGATGIDGGTKVGFVVFPMQAELYANAAVSAFSIHVTAGARDPQYDNTAKTLFASREHWIAWQQPDSALSVRAGRFMPVYGLRFAEHVDYTRRYGGTPLYGEAYGAAVEYVDPRWEVHATGFVHDPFLADSLEHGNGAALYAETRIAETTAIGLEGKLDITPDDKRTYGGVTAKHYFAGPSILVQAEAQVIHQKVDLGGTANQLVGYVLGSYFVGPFMIDLGLGAYEPNVRIRYLDEEALDLNVHWFATSHLEVILLDRFQMLELGAGGRSSGYSLLQLHYRI